MKPNDETRPGDGIDEASVWCLRLADGRLSPETQAEFNAWLAVPENARAFDRVANTWQAFESTSGSPELIDMRRRALESFQRGQVSRWKRGLYPHRRVMALAAALAILFTGAVLWVQLAARSYETGLGERRVVALEDGSRISLDAQTRVDVRLRDDRRELWLKRGRAKFEVAKDSLRPFSVAAADKVVVATGTEFSVELLASQVRVVLYHGSVDVLPHQSRGEAMRAEAPSLAPGRELIITPRETAVIVADPVGSAAWEAGQLVFTEEALSAAVERMNRYAATPMAVADAKVGAVRISGVYAAGNTDAFIEGVTGVFPVRVDRSSGVVTFHSTR